VCGIVVDEISWLLGNAEQLPVGDESCDVYTVAFGIRNMTHIDKVSVSVSLLFCLCLSLCLLFCLCWTSCLGGAVVRRWTRDRKVTDSTTGRGAIKSTRSTIPLR